jgi:lysophospholipase L1-like esterase
MLITFSRRAAVRSLGSKTVLALALALLLFGTVAQAAILTKGVPVKIMPLGDSVTEGKGVSTGCGYRQVLQDMLKAGGYTATFVGKEDNGQPENETGCSKGMANPNHEGYGSARIGMLLGGGTAEKHTALPIKQTMANDDPDVVLLMAGTNDVFGITATDKMKDTMTKLVESIFAAKPDVTVVLASIVPITKVPERSADVDAYNAVLPDIVAKEKAAGHKIEFADVHSVVTPADLSGDKVHPSAIGYKKMAGMWYSVLTGETAP